MTETSDALLELLVGKLKDDTKKFAEEQLQRMRADIDKNLEEVKKTSEEMVRQAKDIVTKCGHVVNLGTIEKPEFEKTHTAFDKILKILSSAKRKEKNIMLVGGAGGGKTHLVKQIAGALKLEFYPMSVGLQTTKSDLLGFINATGTYMPSIVRKAYENGGVLLLDEFDAAHAGVVTILNSLLANGHASFPDKVINKHKDFICIVACNTFGTGSNMEYVGRNRLDGATLDRFITVEVDYDRDLEMELTNNNSWFGVIQQIRENAKRQGIKQIISPRASMDGADLLESGFSPKEVLNMAVFKGCSEEIQRKLTEGINFNSLESGISSTEPRKRHRRTRQEIIDARSDLEFDYILSVTDTSLKIERYNNPVMDRLFLEKHSIQSSSGRDVRFEVEPGFQYGLAKLGTTLWLPKNDEDCVKLFNNRSTAREVHEFLEEFKDVIRDTIPSAKIKIIVHCCDTTRFEHTFG